MCLQIQAHVRNETSHETGHEGGAQMGTDTSGMILEISRNALMKCH